MRERGREKKKKKKRERERERERKKLTNPIYFSCRPANSQEPYHSPQFIGSSQGHTARCGPIGLQAEHASMHWWEDVSVFMQP